MTSGLMAPAVALVKSLATTAGPLQLSLVAAQTGSVTGRGKRGTAEVEMACGQGMAVINLDRVWIRPKDPSWESEGRVRRTQGDGDRMSRAKR